MTAIPAARAAERSVVLGYVPASVRAGVAALLALDDTLARIVRTTREPMVGQMRLTWWHAALVALDDAPAPAEPVLAALAAHVLARGVGGATLADMIDGWEILLDPAMDAAELTTHATRRGGGLFAAMAMAMVLGGGDPAQTGAAGEGWALADLARHVSDPALAEAARAQALERFAVAFATRWPVTLRPLGMLALLARADLRDGGAQAGSPRRLARLLMHRIWGR